MPAAGWPESAIESTVASIQKEIGSQMRGRRNLTPDMSRVASEMASRASETAMEQTTDAAEPNAHQRAVRNKGGPESDWKWINCQYDRSRPLASYAAAPAMA